MHRTSRRQARQDRSCRNVPRGHDGQTQQTGYPASHHPTHRYPILARQQKRLPAAVAGAMLGRSRPPGISTRSPALSLPETRAQGASEQGRRTTQRCSTCGSISDRLAHAAYRLVSCDVPSSRSDHRSRIAHCCRASRYQQALAQSRTVTSLGRGWSRASFRTRLASFWRSSASLAA
jgi:hypothetical protein